MDKNTFSVSFTEEESDKLIELIDIANKARGLAVAATSLHFVSKLQKAFQAANQPPAAPVEKPANVIELKPEPSPTDKQ